METKYTGSVAGTNGERVDYHMQSLRKLLAKIRKEAKRIAEACGTAEFVIYDNNEDEAIERGSVLL